MSGAVATAEPSAWQVQDGNAIVIVEGDRSFALRTALRVRQLRSSARWLIHWPDTYRPPQALIFQLQESTVRRIFLQQPMQAGMNLSPYVAIGAAVALPALSLVVAPIGPDRSVELAPLQGLYGGLLVGQVPLLAGWPPCPRLGLEAMLLASVFNDRDHLHIGGAGVALYEALNPAEFLDAAASAAQRQIDIEQRGFACFVLSHWYATGDADNRAAFEQLFTALGSGRSLAESVPDALGGTLPEFTTRYRRYVARWLFQPQAFDIRTVLPELQTDLPEPIAVTPERLEAFLQQTCAKLSRCRHPPAEVH